MYVDSTLNCYDFTGHGNALYSSYLKDGLSRIRYEYFLEQNLCKELFGVDYIFLTFL